MSRFHTMFSAAAIPLIAAAVFILSLVPLSAVADEGEAGRSQESEVKQDDAAMADDPMISIEFPANRSIKDYYESLAEQANLGEVIFQGPADSTGMPGLSIAQIRLSEAIQLPTVLYGQAVTLDKRPSYTVVRVDPRHLRTFEQRYFGADAEKEAEKTRSTRTIDIRFPGGTANEFFGHIRRFGANVVVVPPAGEVSVPEMHLRSVTVDGAMQLLNGLVAPDGRRLAVVSIQQEVPGPVAAARSDGVRLDPIFRVSLMGTPVKKEHDEQKPVEHTKINIWSISQAVRHGLKPEDVLAAIDAGLELLGSEGQVRYHPETQVLMMQAEPRALQFTGDLIQAATLGAIGRNPVPPPRPTIGGRSRPTDRSEDQPSPQER